MPVYRIIKEQRLNASLPQVWRFFSNPANLQRITPTSMRFRVTSGELPDKIYPGQIITYKLSPLLSIPLFWMTEITQVVPQKFFVDEQRRGPYSMWHHEHHFKEVEGGVIMCDIVYYQLPFGLIGTIAHWLLVRKQIADVFEFRRKQISILFP